MTVLATRATALMDSTDAITLRPDDIGARTATGYDVPIEIQQTYQDSYFSTPLILAPQSEIFLAVPSITLAEGASAVFEIFADTVITPNTANMFPDPVRVAGPISLVQRGAYSIPIAADEILRMAAEREGPRIFLASKITISGGSASVSYSACIARALR